MGTRGLLGCPMSNMAKNLCLMILLMVPIGSASAANLSSGTVCDFEYRSLLDASKWLDGQKTRSAQDGSPGDSNPAEERFLQKARRFLRLCPEDPNFAPVSYKLGKLLYDTNQLAEARKVLDELIRRCPEDENALSAANLVLDSLNLEKNYQGLEDAARQYLANDKLMQHGSLKEMLLQILPSVLHKQANDLFERATKSGLFQRPAEVYLALADEFPTWKHADEALFNAAVCYEKSRQLDQATRVYRRLMRKYPKSRLVKLAHERLAVFPP